MEQVEGLWGWWELASGPMLGWSAAALVPLAVHLLRRRTYRETPWAAMRFLEAAMRRRAGRMRIEQWLLLILRMALLALLAVALADPRSRGSGSTDHRATGPKTHWVFVIDVSYSMAYHASERSLLEESKSLARDRIQAAADGDGFTLVAMGAPAQTRIAEPAFDRADVLRELERLEPLHGGASLDDALDAARRIATRAKRRYPRLTRTRICVFSDLQRTTWSDLDSPGVRRRIDAWAREIPIELVEVGEPAWRNAAVTRLELAHSLVTPDQDARFLAEIRRLSTDHPRRARAIALVDGQVVHEADVDLTSGTETLAFSHRFLKPGDYAVELRIAGADPLDIDNHRWTSVRVRDSLRVLCVEGAPGAARYVAIAIEPSGVEPARLRCETAGPSGLVDRDLGPYACIFLCNVPTFQSEEVESLRRYADSGGGLVFFLGDQVQTDRYNELLHDGERGRALLPARLGSVEADRVHSLDPLEYRHPLVKPFRSHERAGLLTVPIQRHFRLDPTGTTGSRVALGLDNGEPILVEKDYGRGRVFLFGSSVSPAPAGTATADLWTEFPTWPSFPPIVHELLALVLRSADAHREVQVGGVFESESIGEPGAPRLRIIDPKGDAAWLDVDGGRSNASRGPAWRHGPVTWSGVYRVAPDGKPDAGIPYCANVDTAEGVLDRVDPAAMPSIFARESTDEGHGEVSGGGGGGGGEPRSAARGLLAAVLAIVLVECLLASLFGAGRS
ncbi:MAG: VWA domain-containing protein [Planctomycetes bacterium]|nr:VWA domain-containing protein [Planctomycetota bacterium]